MNAVQREIFEDLGRELDGWVRVATDAVSGENPDLTWAGDVGRHAFDPPARQLIDPAAASSGPL